MDENQLFQIRAIVNTLVVRSRQGKINWVWDEAQRTGIATLESGRVIVGKDDDFDTYMRIEDTDSNRLENINVGFPKYKELRPEADELYELARRSALDVDSKLELILREISD